MSKPSPFKWFKTGPVKKIILEPGLAGSQRSEMSTPNPFKGFHSSPEIIRLAVMQYVRLPLSLRNVQDLLHDRGIDVSHETVRFWWNRFGPIFASETGNESWRFKNRA